MLHKPMERATPLGLLALSIGFAHMLRERLGSLDAWAAAHLPVLCPLRAISGVPCPTCGLGRSLLATWSGDLLRAWHLHFLGPVLLLGTALLSAACALHPAGARRVAAALAQTPTAHPKLTGWAAGAYILWGFSRHWL